MEKNVFEYKLDDEIYKLLIKYKKTKRRTFRIKMKLDNTLEIVTNYGYDLNFIYLILEKNKNWIINTKFKYDNYKKILLEKYNLDLDSLFSKRKYLYLGNEYKSIYNFNYKVFFKSNEDVLKRLYDLRILTLNNPPKLILKFLKGRWGSYNKTKHEITLNLYLLFFSEDIINYVIDHEITHINVFNHQKKFYFELSKRCINYKKLKEELKMMTLVSEILVA